MKKVSLLITGLMLFLQHGNTQQLKTVWVENFDNTVTFTKIPSTEWNTNTNYHVSQPNSYYGEVPRSVGDSIILTTPIYDLSVNNYEYSSLRFSHICKVSPRDSAFIEYRTDESGDIYLTSWKRIPVTFYNGTASNYERGFSASSYNSDWYGADSSVTPQQTWWKEEWFNFYNLFGFAKVQFRFIIKRGYVYGSNVSYGWLIDDFEFSASKYDIKPPIVEFITPLIKDTVAHTGPWEINAKVKASTIYPIDTPYLKWTTNGIVFDSVPMTMVRGDSLWKAFIPQQLAETKVNYSIRGKDTVGNEATAASFYIVQKPSGDCGDNSVALTHILSPNQSNAIGGQTMPLKVSIKNKGEMDLTSFVINWKLNGVTKTAYTFNGNLPWDFDTNIVIDNYIPRVSDFDTITVWVSNPNNMQDSIITDDTLTTIIYGCISALAGDYTIGASVGFPSLDYALNVLSLCGASGNVNFLMASNTYNEKWNFANVGNVMGNHILTITSFANDRDSVVIKPDLGVVLTLNNTRNVSFEALTFDGRSNGAYSCVEFTGSCANIAINKCNLLSDTNSNTAISPLYKAASTGVIDGFRLTNCLLDGGVNAANFYGGIANTYGSNIVWDSNIFRNARNAGLLAYYVWFTSLSHNNMVSRVQTNSNINTRWYGAYLYYINIEKMVGNKVVQRSTAITNPWGFNFNDANKFVVPIPPPMLVANNEIIITSGAADICYGIYENGGTSRGEPVYYLHNSILIKGNYETRGIYITNLPTSTSRVIKKNMIHTVGNTSNPIYLNSVFNAANMSIDSNNLYAPTNIGYASGNKTTISAWQTTVTSDKSSVKIRPIYVDSTINLKISNYINYLCVRDGRVIEDIQGILRGGTTCWGAYSNSPFQKDAAVQNISGMIALGAAPGRNDTLKVELFNAGGSLLDTVSLCWEVNNTAMPTRIWTGSLISGEKTVVSLGEFSYIAGMNTAKVYICGLGTKSDENSLNDTTKTEGYVCGNPLTKTVLTIAQSGGDYVDINDFAAAIDTCGVPGNITLYFPGIYSQSLDFRTVAPKLKNIPITITGDTVHVSSGNAVILGKNKNLRFEDIVIKSDAGYCFNVLDTCFNIVIRNCSILADPTATVTSRAGIYKGTATGIWDSIVIVGNILDGGAYNFYSYGNNQNANTLPKYIIFDSNICTNSNTNAINSNYNILRIAYNQISCRQSGGSASWVPVYYNYSNGDIIGNRILAQSSNTITSAQIIYLLYANNYSVSAPMYVANNEIRYLNANASTNGVYIEASGVAANPVHVIHNSIYIAGGASSRGITTSTAVNNCIIKNNNIYTRGASSHPIYMNTVTFSGNNVTVDANNLYAPTNVGYAGSASRTSISAWQGAVSSDKLSVRFLPDFTDTNLNLKMNNFSPFICPQYPTVLEDITGEIRQATTAMGCYTQPLLNLDLRNVGIIEVASNGIQSQVIPIKVKITSMGGTPISSVAFGWSINDSIQQAPPIFNFTPTLALYETEEIMIGSFLVNHSTENIKVWIDKVNGIKDQDNSNDTVNTVLTRMPLAAFVSPFAQDTISNHSFNVSVNIRTETGAPIAPPQLIAATTYKGITTFDTIPMVKNANIWMASVYEKYYGSKVVYSVFVSDMANNSIILTDSVFMKHENGAALYSVGNLSIEEMVSPSMDISLLCSPSVGSTQVVLYNKGNIDYDFSNYNVRLYAQTTVPIAHTADTILKNGILLKGTSMVVEIANAYPMMFSGQYDFKFWLDSPLDLMPLDDTLTISYTSSRLALPIDDNFSNSTLSADLRTKGMNTSATWEVIQGNGTGKDTAVAPLSGTGMLRFVGGMGAVSQLSTRQVDIYNASQPTLMFWYFHDTIPSKDYTDLRITFDGGASSTVLLGLKKYDTNYYGWKEYTLDLSPYTSDPCVIFIFESMSMSNDSIAQYIDRIRLFVNQNFALDAILVPPITVCDFENKDIKVVLHNTSPHQSVDFSKTPTNISLEVEKGTNRQNFVYTLDNKILSPASYDTITITSMNFTIGKYDFTAFVIDIIDNNQSDDTTRAALTINPAISVSIPTLSKGSMGCLLKDSRAQQEVIVKNTGNMTVSNIEIILDIISDSHPQTINDVLNTNLFPGESDTIYINYIVPTDVEYDVSAIAYLACDSALANDNTFIRECVDINDLYIKLIKPQNETKDIVGRSNEIEVLVKNLSDLNAYTNIVITANIERINGELIEEIKEVISVVEHLDSIFFTFKEKYTVPNEHLYVVRIFIDSRDNYLENDTIRVERETIGDTVGIRNITSSDFTLEQNIPNPTNSITRIAYTVPESGEITFKIHTISGQLLYNKVIQSESGRQFIELNTEDFAAGVYLYSIEYKGQKLIKRMSVNK